MAKRNNKLTINKLLKYLVNPLYLPTFDISVHANQYFVNDTVQLLLTEAFKTILPSKVLGVQFVSTKRAMVNKHQLINNLESDFSCPLLLCCKNHEEATKISDGLAYVTKFLTNNSSSFHSRVRKYQLTDVPAICIFSLDPPPKNKLLSFERITVLWVKLPFIETTQIKFPNTFLQPLNEHFNEGEFFQADLKAAIETGYYNEEKERNINIQPNPSDVVQITKTNETATDKKIRDLKRELSSDLNYLHRVAYLLQFGDIILCTPHAYKSFSYSEFGNLNNNEFIPETGLTVIVDRNKGPITEDDWLSVQVVAQKLAIFVGAAVSTAAEARSSITELLREGFLHDFSNTLVTVSARLDGLRRENKPISMSDIRDIEGRLNFTQSFIKSALFANNLITKNIVTMLNDLIKPMSQYHDICINSDIDLTNNDTVLILWQQIIAEALRNAYKHSEIAISNNKKHVHISTKRLEKGITISIKNKPNKPDSDYVLTINEKYQGWEWMLKLAKKLGGSVKPSKENDLIVVTLTIPLM